MASRTPNPGQRAPESRSAGSSSKEERFFRRLISDFASSFEKSKTRRNIFSSNVIRWHDCSRKAAFYSHEKENKMRKIIVTMWVTLDGFIAGPNQEMDWIGQFYGEAMGLYE